jgi:two-component system, LytTR family, sensor kinase
MKEPSFLNYAVLVTVSLAMGLAGLYLLGNFNRLFRGTIKNAWLRRNAAAWLIIFLLNGSMAPLSGGFFYFLERFGWLGTVGGHFVGTMIATLIGFNIVWAIAENKRLKRLSFIKHKLLLFFTLIIMTLLVNVPFSYLVYSKNMMYVKYTIISSIYVGGCIGLVYALISYLDIERKRKFDEKELELIRLRELKAKAELDALHSKVNPHFLYNALNSIADLSITDGKKARKMTVALADLFRYSINYSNNNYSTIKEEMEMAEVYLQIEKIRFEDKLNYHVEVNELLNHYLVPRFLIQPLVENAVKHGLKATGQLTELVLEVIEDGDGIVMNIADTGPSFPDELNPGYGVKSVYDKLDLLFANNYEIRFSNSPRKQVSIHLKKMIKSEPEV